MSSKLLLDGSRLSGASKTNNTNLASIISLPSSTYPARANPRVAESRRGMSRLGQLSGVASSSRLSLESHHQQLDSYPTESNDRGTTGKYGESLTPQKRTQAQN